jgi:hypothetical protein
MAPFVRWIRPLRGRKHHFADRVWLVAAGTTVEIAQPGRPQPTAARAKSRCGGPVSPDTTVDFAGTAQNASVRPRPCKNSNRRIAPVAGTVPGFEAWFSPVLSLERRETSRILPTALGGIDRPVGVGGRLPDSRHSDALHHGATGTLDQSPCQVGLACTRQASTCDVCYSPR